MFVTRIAAVFFASVSALYSQAATQDLGPSGSRDFLKPFKVDSFAYQRPPLIWTYRPISHRSGSAHLALESFGVSGRMARPAADATAPIMSGFDLHGLECPGCAVGMLLRSRTTLQPFGAKVSVNLLHGRLQLFSSFGGTESWSPEGMLQGLGVQSLGRSPLSAALGGINGANLPYPDRSFGWGNDHLLTYDQYIDQWLLQSHIGVRAFLDREHNISVGITKGYLDNKFNPIGQRSWASTSADLTIRFNSIPVKAIARKMRRPRKIFFPSKSPATARRQL